jgi:hypothetical protein
MDLNDVGMMERVAPVIAQNQIVLGHKGIDLLINAVLYVETEYLNLILSVIQRYHFWEIVL